MSRHTKGPWKAVDHAHYPGMMVVEGPEMPITIITSALDVDVDSYMRRVANAYLIAAAPDLLEALEFVAKNCAADLTYSEADKIIEIARKAIARAKGQS